MHLHISGVVEPVAEDEEGEGGAEVRRARLELCSPWLRVKEQAYHKTSEMFCLPQTPPKNSMFKILGDKPVMRR